MEIKDNLVLSVQDLLMEFIDFPTSCFFFLFRRDWARRSESIVFTLHMRSLLAKRPRAHTTTFNPDQITSRDGSFNLIFPCFFFIPLRARAIENAPFQIYVYWLGFYGNCLRENVWDSLY